MGQCRRCRFYGTPGDSFQPAVLVVRDAKDKIKRIECLTAKPFDDSAASG